MWTDAWSITGWGMRSPKRSSNAVGPLRAFRRVLITVLVGFVGSAMTLVAAAIVSSAPAWANPTPPQVTAGGAPGVPNAGHSCALLPSQNQSVWCWGDNSSGQLGNGTTTGSNVPVKVAGLPSISQVSAGANHTCAVDVSNNVWCWGDNSFGELGNGTFNQSATPVKVTGILATQVVAGYGFSCAVTTTSKAECWGDGNDGQLGNKTNSDSDTPVPVKNLTGITQVAAGGSHACALTSRGAMWCWGDNLYGQLGDGMSGGSTGSNVPVSVSTLDADVRQIGAGGDHTCADLIGGDLKCWGDNSAGQLGTGTFADEDVPTQVAGLSSGTDQFTLGFAHTCAIVATPGAQAVCWGNGVRGDLGNGQFGVKGPGIDSPTAVFSLMALPNGGSGVSDPVQLAAGYDHTCAALFSGKVECWGAGEFGEIGDGDALDRAIPTPTIGLPNGPGTANAVSVGGETGCAIDATLSAKCWGTLVGDGSSSPQLAATAVANVPTGGIAQVSAAYGGCVLSQKGVVKCWGANDSGQVGNGTNGLPVPTPSAVAFSGSPKPYPEAISAGGEHTCALTGNGTGVYCWGDNFYGELGDGTSSSTPQDSPVAVQMLGGSVAQVAAGDYHTCALLKSGTVQCWGRDTDGELGNNTTSSSPNPNPVDVSGLSGVVQIALGNAFSCALDGGGNVSCWGDNGAGELGNGSGANSPVPVAVSGIGGGNPAIAITAGDQHACAVLLSGTVECWGAGTDGQLGNGKFSDQPLPVPVSSFTSDGASISADAVSNSTCALNSSEVAQCWGYNRFGQLGDGASGPGTNRAKPVTVKGL